MTVKNNSYLILDSIRLRDVKKICAQNEQEWQPLYLGTDWQHQIDLSPICVRVEPNSTIVHMWETNPDWATSGIVFTFSPQISSERAIASLQKNITVACEDGRLFLLRFYSPSTFTKIVKFGEQEEIDGVLGLAHSAQISPLLSNIYLIDKVENRSCQALNTLLSKKLVKELLA